MRHPRAAAALAALYLTLAACAQQPDATGATPGEAKLLNDSAAMLDANSVTANAVAADPQ